jgi:hypothetical protein
MANMKQLTQAQLRKKALAEGWSFTTFLQLLAQYGPKFIQLLIEFLTELRKQKASGNLTPMGIESYFLDNSTDVVQAYMSTPVQIEKEKKNASATRKPTTRKPNAKRKRKRNAKRDSVSN